ncbi:MAG: hypothetical protein RQ745_12800, partial [Longimicrobiales bacterium]|nr:hypothetical protein [Longimicrobiales bacterium]
DGGSDQIPLSGVRDIRGLPDGRVVFGNLGSREVLVYDSLGRLDRRLGGAGDGPGDLRGMGGLFPCAGEMMLVSQGYSLDLFHVEDGFVRRHSAQGESRPVVRAVTADCRRILTEGERRSPPLGEHGYLRQALIWSDTAFAVLDTVAIDSIPGAWTRLHPDGSVQVVRLPPWWVEFPLVVRDTLLIRGSSARPELRWHLPDGRVQRIVRWGQAPAPVTASDRRLYDGGRWLGEVEMPERFALHVVAGGRVLGVAKDSLDVETVRAYRILR